MEKRSMYLGIGKESAPDITHLILISQPHHKLRVRLAPHHQSRFRSDGWRNVADEALADDVPRRDGCDSVASERCGAGRLWLCWLVSEISYLKSSSTIKILKRV